MQPVVSISRVNIILVTNLCWDHLLVFFTLADVTLQVFEQKFFVCNKVGKSDLRRVRSVPTSLVNRKTICLVSLRDYLKLVNIQYMV